MSPTTNPTPPPSTLPTSSTTLPTRGRPSTSQHSSTSSATIPTEEETYDAEHDARGMSPRRPSDEIEKMGDGVRLALEEQARTLQANLLEIVERVDVVKSEHEKLEGRNRFLQSYIGELMQTSKITASGAGDGKKKGRKGR